MSENYDQIRTRAPFTTLDGTETLTINQSGSTKGGFLSVLKTWVLEGLTLTRAAISDATAYGRTLMEMADADALKTEVLPAEATSLELEEGTVEDARMFTPNLIVDAIAHHTAPKVPQFIEENTTIADSHLGAILVCDAPGAIALTVADLTSGQFEVINLAVDAVSIEPDVDVVFMDSTGTITSKTVAQYAHVRVSFIGNSTWYIKEE